MPTLQLEPHGGLPPPAPGAVAQPTHLLREAVYLCFRHKKKILLCTLLGLVLPLLIIAAAPRVYRSQAQLLIRFIAYQATPDAAAARQTLYGPRTWDNVFHSELVILQGRALAERTVDALGPERFASAPARTRSLDPPEQREAAIQQVLESLKISTPGRSNIIHLSYDDPEAPRARDVLATLIRQYRVLHAAAHRAGGSQGVLEKELAAVKHAMEEEEALLQALKDKEGMVSLDQRRETLARRISGVQTEIEQVESDLTGLLAERTVLDEQLRTQPVGPAAPSLTDEPSLAAFTSDQLRSRLQRLRLQEADLLTRFREGSIPVRDVRRQADAIQDRLFELSGQPATNRHAVQADHFVLPPLGELAWTRYRVKTRLAALQARAGLLRERQADLRREAIHLNELDRQLRGHQREVSTLASRHARLTESLEQSRIDQALQRGEVSNISVLQSPTRPTHQIRTIHSRNVFLLFSMGGLLCGLVLAATNEYFLDPTIKRPKDLHTRLSIPVLGVIPRMKRDLRRSLRRLTSGPIPAGSLAPAVQQHFDRLLNRLLLRLSPAANGPFRLGLTSTRPGEGVTTVASTLAMTLAQSGTGRVLLIDAYRQQGSSGARTSKHQPEIPAVLDLQADEQGRVTVIQPNLFVLVSHDVGPGQPPMQAFDAFDDMLRHIDTSGYRYVLFDLPPLLDHPRGARMTSALDGLLLVVEAEGTREEDVREAHDLIQQAGTLLLGSILNKHRNHLPRWLNQRL